MMERAEAMSVEDISDEQVEWLRENHRRCGFDDARLIKDLAGGQEYLRGQLDEARAEVERLRQALEVAARGGGMPVDSRGGWHFPSRLPPLDAEAATRK
jgi:hypothetical protein